MTHLFGIPIEFTLEIHLVVGNLDEIVILFLNF